MESGPLPTRRLASHPAPRFVTAGGVTFLIDIGFLKLLHGVAGMQLAAATALAFLIAFAFNFTVSRHWTFPAAARGGRTRHQLIKFTIVVVVNFASTILIVVGLSGIGVNYLLAKVVAGACNAVGNFFVYRHWVFL